MMFEFGVMSSKWKLEAKDLKIAQIAMALFIGKDIPVAIYAPEQIAFFPKDVLDPEVDPATLDGDAIRAAYKSIEEVAL